MMDAQKITRLNEIQFRLNMVTDGFDIHYDNDVYFLLQLVSDQEEDICQSNDYIKKLVAERDDLQERIVSLGVALSASKSIVAKYERVVEASKKLVKKARENKAVTGDNGQPDWYEYSESDFDALTDAIDELEAK